MSEAYNREAWRALSSVAEWVMRAQMGDAAYERICDEEGNRRDRRADFDEREWLLKQYVQQEAAREYERGWKAGYATAVEKFDRWSLYPKDAAREAWEKQR